MGHSIDEKGRHIVKATKNAMSCRKMDLKLSRSILNDDSGVYSGFEMNRIRSASVVRINTPVEQRVRIVDRYNQHNESFALILPFSLVKI
jgi:hypothetical protein